MQQNPPCAKPTENLDNDNEICKDFLRNVCKRGRKCKYKHPATASHSDAPRDPVFCHDFQNGICHRASCKFLHYTKKEEGYFRLHGLPPPPTHSELDSYDSDVPVCKDFLNHKCHRGSACKFRHGKPTGDVQHDLVPAPPALGAPASIHQQASCYQDYNSPYSSAPQPPAPSAVAVNHTSNSLPPPPPQQQQHYFSETSAPLGILPPRSTESAVTTPEATAMVAMAAAAGYLAMQKHGQQQQQQAQAQAHHHHQLHNLGHHQHLHHHQQQQNLGGGMQVSSASALPSASAAAVAAAAAATAATAFATTQQRHQHQQESFNHRYSETALTASQSATIPVMQSILGAVTNSTVLNSNESAYSSAPAPQSTPVATGMMSHLGAISSSCNHFSDFNRPIVSNSSQRSPFYVGGPDGASKPVNARATFSQHSQQQQQEANAAAAVAAAACFGAILSQPVAAAAAASHAAAAASSTNPPACGSTSITDDHALSSVAALPPSHPPASSSATTAAAIDVVAGPPPPPTAATAASPSAMAAAAAAAAAAAVVSSADPSAAAAAISAAHLATSSLSHVHSATQVSCAPLDATSHSSRFVSGINSPSNCDGVRGHETLIHRHLCAYSANGEGLYCRPHLNLSPRPPAQQPQLLESSQTAPPLLQPPPVSIATASAATAAAYTATMTTAAAAAAAMAAAVAVKEHSQQKSAATTAAAAAAMAAFSESTSLAHEMQSVARVTERIPLSPETSSLLVATKKSLSAEASGVHPRLRRQRTRFSAFDMVHDPDDAFTEAFSDGLDEDIEEFADPPALPTQQIAKPTPATTTTTTTTTNIITPPRSQTPDRTFGRSPPIVDAESQRRRSQSLGSMSSMEKEDQQSEQEKSKTEPVNVAEMPKRTPIYRKHHRFGAAKRAKLEEGEGNATAVASAGYAARQRYQGFTATAAAAAMSAEIDEDEDEEEEYGFGEGEDFYPPTLYRRRLRELRSENERLKMRLKRLVQQRHQLQLENHALYRQNMLLRSKSAAGKSSLGSSQKNGLGQQPQPSRSLVQSMSSRKSAT